MFYGRACAFLTLAVVTVVTVPANGQSVISTRSGVVHFFEGTVYLVDQPLESHLGKFSSIPQGGELRTAEGRAEVLLTPEVFLRIGERSAIRMVANELSDTRVALLAGSAVVDSGEPSPGTSVTLIYRDWSIHFLEKGVYRIDSDPPRLWVFQGSAEVSTTQGALLVAQGMDVPFAPVLVPERSMDQPHDALSTWAEGRQQSISADNTIAANIQDPGSINASNSGIDSFTYFPALGLPPYATGLSGPFSSLGTYQPGFNSIYLPGYTYLPLFLGAASGGGFLSPLRLPPHGGILPFPLPHAPVPHRTPVHPVFSRPTAVHPISRGGMHGAVHR
jgi:hypothetical protein